MSSVSGIDLVVTDLDGTLWDSAGRLHPRTLRALQVLEAASIPVLAATGRRAQSAWPVMEANGIGMPTVLLDGALGREFGSASAFHVAAFSVAAATELLEVLEELGVSPVINVDDPDRDVVLGARPSTHPDHVRFVEPWTRSEDPWTAVRTLRVLAFTLVGGETSAIRELAAAVTARVPVAAACSIDRTYGGLHLSFRPLGVHKWAGVVAFCAARGLDSARVLADRRLRQRSRAPRGRSGSRRCRRTARLWPSSGPTTSWRRRARVAGATIVELLGLSEP